MRQALRPPGLLNTALVSLLAFLLPTSMAEAQNPVMVQVTGQVQPCSPQITTVTIESITGVIPPVNQNVPTDASCSFSAFFTMDSLVGEFLVYVNCGGGTGDADTVSYAGNFLDTVTVSAVLTCPGVVDCEGVLNGTALPGTPCDDNNPITVNDTWDANCDCVGSVPGACDAGFWPIQAYFIDSLTGDPVPLFNEVWLIDQSTSWVGAVAYAWDFGDGTTSTDAQPTHVYGGPGPYVICLAITDTTGCTDQYCDTVTVDADGLLNGLVGGEGARNGFTVRVVDPLTVAIPGPEEPTEVRLWPVPGTDHQQLSFICPTSGPAQLDLIAMDGRMLLTRTIMLTRGPGTLDVPLTTLPEGPFLIRLTTAEWALHRHSMKQ